MNNSRFAIAIHILTLLHQEKGELVSSEYLAGSININPVLVRKELGNLAKAGLIASKEGKNGGSYLAKAAENITLDEVYMVVRQDYLLGQNKNTPNPQCPVGKQINGHLKSLYEVTELALISSLAKQTLADFSGLFN